MSDNRKPLFHFFQDTAGDKFLAVNLTGVKTIGTEADNKATDRYLRYINRLHESLLLKKKRDNE